MPPHNGMTPAVNNAMRNQKNGANIIVKLIKLSNFADNVL